MKDVVKKLSEHASSAPSKWREEALWREQNKSWLRYSQAVAIKMLDKMEALGLTQKDLAERMGCSQQYVSKVLKGRENLSIETLSKIEVALDLKLLTELVPA